MIGMVWSLVALVLFLVLPIVVVVVLVMLAVKAGDSPGVGGKNAQPISRRDETFREKRNAFREEQSRILGMVAEGKISPEEGDRLIASLERETSTMACPYCGEEIRVEAVKCKHCHSMLYQGVGGGGTKRLTKSNNKVLAGVCGGVAEYFDMDPTLVRVLVALITFFSAIITGLIIYVIVALILPPPESTGGVKIRV